MSVATAPEPWTCSVTRMCAQTTSMPAHLFVYGTLMASANTDLGRAERRRLAAEGEVISVATIRGRLYDLGRYPGLVIDGSGAVHGELVRLNDAAATFAWLDPYENVSSPPAPQDEYARRICAVTAESGRALDAWVYIYGGGLDGAEAVPTGRWRTTM
jgi:gamma-glutamylcyclotransferase (GGCT)/AIG2-like uncharacterized protein YtfP